MKYKAIVKFNLDHPKYFERRDKLADFVNEEANKDYIRLMLINFIT